VQRREDKLLIPLMAGTIIVSAGVLFGIGILFDKQWILLPLGVVLGALGAFVLFGRRVQRTVYAKADGQPGAAGWALDNMRGRWKVTQTVATNHPARRRAPRARRPGRDPGRRRHALPGEEPHQPGEEADRAAGRGHADL